MTLPKGTTGAYLALITAVVLWSSSFVALKIAFKIYDPMVVIFGRMIIASFCFMFVFRKLRHINYQPGDWKLLLFMAVCEPGLYFVFEAMALTYTDASQAGMICAILPLLVAIPAHFYLKERMTKRTLVGFGMAIAGAVILSLAAEASDNAPNPLLGNFLEFMAMVCATGYIITLKNLTKRYSPWFLTMFQAFIGSLFFFPMQFLPSTVPPTVFDPVGVAAIAYLGVFVTIGAYGMYNVGMAKVPASQASTFVNLIPVITMFFGWIVLGEQLTVIQYAASAIVLAGVYVSQDRKAET